MVHVKEINYVDRLEIERSRWGRTKRIGQHLFNWRTARVKSIILLHRKSLSPETDTFNCETVAKRDFLMGQQSIMWKAFKGSFFLIFDSIILITYVPLRV